MKYFLIILAVPVVLAKQCGAGNDSIPVCVQRKIDSVKMQPKWNPPAEVNEYTYKGQRVFLFTANCCDQFYMLYDGSCNYICAPSGGFSGKGDGKCADFAEKAKHIKLTWKDSR
jgi:hypothetical protein